MAHRQEFRALTRALTFLKGLSFSERIERCDSVCRLNSFHFPQFFGRLIWNDDGAVLLTYQDCGEEDHERGPPPLPGP